ncbi:MAG: tetratricopeptide repeat protein [Microscillaceae bacterium]|nr:tetratricopeptide repeat protein [Microscillaceae bacterium]
MKFSVICFFLLICSSFKIYAQDFKEAMLAFESQEYDEARLIIDQLIEQESQNAEIWYYRGKIYAEIANDLRGIYLQLDTLALFKAYDSFVEALNIENSNFKDSARAGLDSLYNTAINSAGKYFKQAFQRERQTSSSNDIRTYSLFRAAFGASNLAIRLNPKRDTLSYAIAAYSALSTGYFDDYVETTENLIQNLPNQEDKYRHYESMVAICRDRINDLDLTLAVLDKALAVFPDDEKFQTERININDELGKNHDKLLLDTKAKIKANPREPINYYNLAVIYQRMERYDEAIENYYTCIEYDQSNFDAMFNIAGIFYNRGIDKLKKISKLTFTEYQIRGDKEEASANQDFKQALNAFERAYALYPNNIKILGPMYYICKRLKMKDKESDLKNRIMIIEPDFFKTEEKREAASSNLPEEPD